MYASMHRCMHASMHLCMYASMHLCMYASMYVCISQRLLCCSKPSVKRMTYALPTPRPHLTVHCLLQEAQGSHSHKCSSAHTAAVAAAQSHSPSVAAPSLLSAATCTADRSCEATAARMFESQCDCIVGSTELVRSSWPMRSSAAYKAHIASSCSLSFVCALTASHCGRSRRDRRCNLHRFGT